MKIIVGSVNQAKMEAIKIAFPNKDVVGVPVSSGVLDQPIGDEMTRQGAINRAIGARDKAGDDTIGIGLEGGIMFIDDQCYVCNWGALVSTNNQVYTAGGARISLPDSFKSDLLKGEELGTLMERYTKIANIRSQEGAVGIFTNGLMARKDMFAHVGVLLRGQLIYAEKIG